VSGACNGKNFHSIDFHMNLSIFFLSQFFFSLPFHMFAAYPIAIGYRLFVHDNSKFSKTQSNLLFTLCGIMICIFNYGIEVYHSLGAVLFTYILINLMYKSKYLVPISFTYHMSYLLIGNYSPISIYYDNLTENPIFT
jgi:lysophospholipid acyltransferase 5